jgi:hypothetical protein
MSIRGVLRNCYRLRSKKWLEDRWDENKEEEALEGMIINPDTT